MQWGDGSSIKDDPCASYSGSQHDTARQMRPADSFSFLLAKATRRYDNQLVIPIGWGREAKRLKNWRAIESLYFLARGHNI
jgi:hypothetical protein